MLFRILAYLWASPNTLVLGMPMALLARLTGGQIHLHTGVIEVSGGAVAKLLQHVPLMGGAMAMTLGHVVIARSTAAHDLTRDHERVHVRQYERWGPLFVPAYFAASGWAWIRRRDAYRDNYFERQAFNRE